MVYLLMFLSKIIRSSVVLVAVGLISIVSAAQPTTSSTLFKDSKRWAPNSWLIDSKIPSWWYIVKESPTPARLQYPELNESEGELFRRLDSEFMYSDAKAIALVDGYSVKYQSFNTPATEFSTYFGFSMGKTLTAMGVGKAICARKLDFGTKASEFLPELRGSALGDATVHDLLRMASGTAIGKHDTSVMTPEQFANWQSFATVLYRPIISEARVSAAERGLFSDYRPGEVFRYKGTDPLVLSMMVSEATGMPWTSWLQENVFNQAGTKNQGSYSTDRSGTGSADAGLRATLDDWIRLAIWIQSSREETGCFGDFVRKATSKQIDFQTKGESSGFYGYGYFTWISHPLVPDSYWAFGHGGQAIGWSTRNKKIVVMFSNFPTFSEQLYRAAREWFSY